VRRGGRDTNKMLRSLLREAAGVVAQTVAWLVSDHPVCGAKVGFAKISLMPQPPLLTRRGLRFVHILLYCILFFSQIGFAFAGSDVADAVMRKDSQAVRALLKQNANPNTPQADGTTALHWAARWDDVEIASALIRAGANPQAPNRDGATPMFLATLNGSAAM